MRISLWILLTICVVLFNTRAAESTKCWVCYQAKSNRECLIRGFAKTCSPGEGCENEVRYSGMFISITKRCKQVQACSNDQYQNSQLSNNRYQCGSGRKNSVCRCCCNSDNCNKNQLTCVDKGSPKCRFLYLPNGSTRCFGSADGISVGSRCRFSCKAGFQVKGARSAFCRKNGELAFWSRKMPKCRRRPTCARFLSHDFTNGIVRCRGTTGIATLGTSCVFRCKPRYFMANTDKRKSSLNYETTVCTMRKDVPTWSKRPPTCIEEMCPIASNLDHGVATCTNFNKLGSECQFSCFPGYDLVGLEKISCVQQPGFRGWDGSPPICQPRPCPADTFNSPMLNIECSHFNLFGSICSISCRKGYYIQELVGKSQTKIYTSTCSNGGVEGVNWDLPPPTCVAKRCPGLRTPEDGKYTCTNDRRYLSRCTFSCPSQVHHLIGQPVLTCTEDGDQSNPQGFWSDDVPSCEYKECPELNLDTTKVDCTNGFIYNSVCTFSCKPGFHMVASDGIAIISGRQVTTTTCSLIDGEVSWSDEPPRCEKKQCPKIAAAEGVRITCTDDENLGSRCSFSCYDGYRRVGKQTTECVEGSRNQIQGKWTSDAAICEPRTCRTIYYDRTSSDLSCSNEFKFETVCTLGCNEGYFMRKSPRTPVIDRLKTTCLFEDGYMVWSDAALNCRPKRCNAPTAIENGAVKCSEELIYGAKCEFSCNRGYGLVGSRVLSCGDDDTLSAKGKWSSVPPTCEPKKCEPLEFDSTTMIAKCDKGSEYNSKCTVECKPNHFIPDPVTNKNIFQTNTTCILDDDNDMYWSPQPQQCIPVSCKSLPTDVYHTCTNGNNTNSMCTFSCAVGYDLVGNTTNRCEKVGEYDAKWRSPLPECKVRTCISQVNDEDMDKTCTSGNDYESVCSFSCQRNRGLFMTRSDDGTIVDSGVVESSCKIDRRGQMFWTGVLPKCHVKYCLASVVRRPPPNGRVRCRDGSKFRSTCAFSCNQGYRRVGRRVLTCLEGTPNSPQGKWSADPPKCRKR